MPDYNHIIPTGAAQAAQDAVQAAQSAATSTAAATDAAASAANAAASESAAATSATEAANSAANAATSQAESVWILNDGPPSNGLGDDGNMCLDTSGTGNYYRKTAGAWGLIGSLRGPEGQSGALPPAPAGTMVGNNTGADAVPVNLAPDQVKALLGLGNVLDVEQIPASSLGQPNGTPQLGPDGKVLSVQLPTSASSDVSDFLLSRLRTCFPDW